MASVTKKRIAQEFLDLSYQKEIDKITVKDIVERVEITRQTFYYHFKDIFDLIEWVLNQKMTEIYQDSLQVASMKEAIRILLSIVEEHPSLIIKIQSSQHHELINKLVFNTIKSYFEQLIDTKQLFMDLSRADMIFSLHFYSHAIVGIIFEACQNAQTVDIDEMANQIYRLVTNKMPTI